MILARIIAAATVSAAMAATVLPAAASANPGYNRAGYQTVAYKRGHHRTHKRHYRSNHRCYDKGNGGLAIGGIAGGLLGHEVAGRGDKTLGTIIGAGAGALAGRAIDKSDGRPC